MREKTKPKIAIYDFTDCEGCELEIISLRENCWKLKTGLILLTGVWSKKKKSKARFWQASLKARV